jgi:hypothetical protein
VRPALNENQPRVEEEMLWAGLLKVKRWDYLELEGCIVTPGGFEACESQVGKSSPSETRYRLQSLGLALEFYSPLGREMFTKQNHAA